MCVSDIAGLPDNHPSGWGGILASGTTLRWRSTVADHCPAILAMWNATNETFDDDIELACQDTVLLQCWPHLVRKVLL